MLICCTKKLLDEMGKATEDAGEENDLFCWSAHLITVNRKRTVVVVNDKNRFGFILYGLKAREIARLKEFILEGITKSLRDMKIKEEIIERYMKKSGECHFTKTRGRNYVSRLNKACEFVEAFREELNSDVSYYSKVSRIMNRDLVKIDGADYRYPEEMLLEHLQEFAGEQAISCRAADLIIKMELGSNTVWRRIITPADINFEQLHNIIQAAFNWKRQHLYNFNIFDDAGKRVLNLVSVAEEVCEPSQDCKTLLDTDTELRDFLDKHYKIMYCYDYGDNWNHEISIQGIIEDYDKNYPICIMGEGDAPPEDVGGIPGYERFIGVMSNPKDKEYDNTFRWAISQGYREFSINYVNWDLRHVLP